MEVISSGGGAAAERLSSHNLRELLGIKEECHHASLQQSTSSTGGGGRHNPSGLTLEAVLREKRPPPPPPPAAAAADEPLQSIQSNRTLLDIIREDQTPTLAGGGTDSRRSWRHLKNKIRLRRRGGGGAPFRQAARFSSTTNSAEPTQPDISNNPETNSNSNRRIAAEEVQEPTAEPPVRMSLMSLLAENDRQMGLEGSAYIMDEDPQEGEEEDDGTITGGGGAAAYNSCCVCMVRHKGAAFIPCGHTFCRLCSRELWVQRGNCPLCNNYILEILDIF